MISADLDPLPSKRQMSSRQVSSAGWTSLPEPLATRILRQAFHDSGGSLLKWLHISSVCRCDRSLPVGLPANQACSVPYLKHPRVQCLSTSVHARKEPNATAQLMQLIAARIALAADSMRV